MEVEVAALKQEKVLFDALPYNDGDITPDMAAKVQELIATEMRTFVPSSYLEGRPPVPLRFDNDEVLRNEHDRMEASDANPHMPDLDVLRYRAKKPPPNYAKNLDAWEQSLKNSKAQLQSQYNWVENLELTKLYGPNAWKVYNEYMVNVEKSLEAEYNVLKKKADELNWERKKEQTQAGDKLSRLESQYFGLVRKNFEIQATCHRLADEIRFLVQQTSATSADNTTATETQE